jgi:hypothetical protein
MAVLPTGIGPVTGGYQIERSLRFNSADSAYLNRTPASASNRQKFTLSLWEKGGNPTANDLYLLSTGGTSTERFTYSIKGNGGQIGIVQVVGGVVKIDLVTTAVYRDPSAWYHFVLSVDTTQATPSFILYVNGVQATLTGTNSLAQNANTQVNNTNEHDIGKYFAGANYLNGYLTEVNFIDGQALTPSSFGETDSATGVWKPKAYSGTYGTNGFFLKFADNSGTTSTTLGKDSSGNGNNWTPNNFSVTAGAGNDSLVDSPTAYGTDTGVGGSVRGNYCTLNPLRIGASSSLANGNLDFTSTSSAGSIKQSQITGTIGIPASGKWYFECTPTTIGASIYIGVISDTHSMDSQPFSGTPIRAYRSSTGDKSDGGTDSAYGNTYTTNDVIGVAVNMDAGEIKFYKNGTVQNSGTAAFTNLAGTTWVPYCVAGSSGTTNNGNFNFGQRAFAYTAPSGFKALCTTNLPTPTIGATSTTQAGKYFDIVLYQAATTNGTFTRGNLSFRPDFTWIKNRDNVERHFLIDAVRGNTSVTDKFLVSNSTAAEGANTVDGTTFSVTDTGYEFVESSINSGELFFNNRTYVGWNWNAGGSNATNTSGTITSTVRANTTSGFSIVTYTGTGGSGTTTVGHGLGVAPQMVIVKRRSTTGDWSVYHQSLTSTSYYLGLNTTAAQQTYGSTFISPGSSTLTIAADSSLLNANASTYVAYCFAPVAGYSAFGSYTGNGSNDGPFVYTGFRPRYVLIKRTDTGGAGFDWFIWDTARDTYNQMTSNLTADQNVAEGVTAYPLDALSNGFKVRNAGTAYNASGGTYIYAAFAEAPFKYSLAR